ncbi:MAG TPA: phosphatase PAP2 family protein [Rhizomicrobium sp.]|nr:phosphatase PAP2 family protein [Rhizomicrobium sp.]
MQTARLWAGVIALAVGAASASAFAKPIFLTPPDYDPKLLLPAPPLDGSPAAKAELSELESIEATRSNAEFAKALHDDETENATIFEATIGDGFVFAKFPATAKLMSEVRNDEKEAASAAKNLFLRNRPWIVEPALKTCARSDPPQSSYPSGHATMGYAMAVVLGALVPEKAQAIMARANEYAENRLVCSMHYRRDIVAGEVLGTAVGVALLHNTAFKADFDAAEQELRAAHLTQ